jgi:hypothetical protein
MAFRAQSDCLWMGPWGVFDGWNQLPLLPDQFEPPTDQGEGPRSEYLIKRCWVDIGPIVGRLEQLRKNYPKEKLDKIYVSTNEDEKWLQELEKALEAQGGWRSIKSTLDLDLTWEESGVDNAIGADELPLSFFIFYFYFFRNTPQPTRLPCGRHMAV